jgi:hypothetical protein
MRINKPFISPETIEFQPVRIIFESSSLSSTQLRSVVQKIDDEISNENTSFSIIGQGERNSATGDSIIFIIFIANIVSNATIGIFALSIYKILVSGSVEIKINGNFITKHEYNSLVDTILKAMTEEPKRVIHTDQYIEKIEGGYHEHNYAQEQNLSEAITEVQKLLDQLTQIYPNETEGTLIINDIQAEIKRNSTLKSRLIGAMKSGGIEALKVIFNHPLVSIPVETIKGFLETE